MSKKVKIGVMADCSSGLEYAPFEHDVKIVRTTINFGEEVLTDGVDITAEEFYKRLVEQKDIVPSTSAPTMGEIIKRANEFKEDGCTDVIFFTISNGLSTYGQNLTRIKDDLVDGVNLHVVNSYNACIMEGYQAYLASVLAKQGKLTIPEIIKQTEVLCQNTNAYFVVDDLKYLVKNGRLTATKAFIGTLANIKPVLHLGYQTNGLIVTQEKVRTKKKACFICADHLVDECKDAKKVIYSVLHTGAEEEAMQYVEYIKARATNAYRVELGTITPTVGAHIGPGLLGFVRIILDDTKAKI